MHFLHSALSLAQPLEKSPLWHTFDVQNPTLSGTLLENPTLCGSEINQNGILPQNNNRTKCHYIWSYLDIKAESFRIALSSSMNDETKLQLSIW